MRARVNREQLGGVLTDTQGRQEASVGGRGRAAVPSAALFHLLYSPEGYSRFQRWALGGGSSASHAGAGLDQDGFVTALRQSTDLGDCEILELFEWWDRRGQGRVLVTDLFLLVSLLVAADARQCAMWLHMHAGDAFTLLARTSASASIPFGHFCQLHSLLGLDHRALLDALAELRVSQTDQLSFEEFETYSFVVLQSWDGTCGGRDGDSSSRAGSAASRTTSAGNPARPNGAQGGGATGTPQSACCTIS